MTSRALTSAAGVIRAAIAQGHDPAGIADALDSAGLLNSPELAQQLAESRSVVEDPIAYVLTPKAAGAAMAHPSGKDTRGGSPQQGESTHRHPRPCEFPTVLPCRCPAALPETSVVRARRRARIAAFFTGARDGHTKGHLVRREQTSHRFYTLNSRGGDA
ncbi:hypothetical protein [Streptomyces sp. NPDC058045]|uniref:hypothetical protein n=1 Tax=Streptomyces sp. NPDC058045 TaxID=3346311 RepID=UPI0036E095E2